MEFLNEICAEVNKIVWGPVMLTLLICVEKHHFWNFFKKATSQG